MKIFRYILPFILGLPLLGLSGCKSTEPVPSVVFSKSYSSVDREKQRGLPAGNDVLTREIAKQIALANNPTYKEAYYSMKAAWAAYYKSLAAYSPTVSVSFTATQTQYSPYLGTGSTSGTGRSYPWSTNYNGYITGNWVIFNGLMRTMDMLSAKATAGEEEALNRDSQRTLIESVDLAYNDILLSKAQISIDQSNLDFQEEMVKYSELKYKAGSDSLSTLLNFQISRNSAENDLIEERGNYSNKCYVLAALMGLTTSEIPEQTVFPEVKGGSQLNHYLMGIEYYLDMAIAQRPDLEGARKSLKAYKYSLYSAWGAFSPVISVFTQYGYSRTTTPTNHEFFGGSARPRSADAAYNYGVDVNLDIWEGGARFADLSAAKANFASAKESLLASWITTVQDVRTAYALLEQNVAQAKVLKENESLSLKQRDLVKEEYEAGNVDITRLNEAQNDYVASQSDYITALVNLNNARVQLDAACGNNS